MGWRRSGGLGCVILFFWFSRGFSSFPSKVGKTSRKPKKTKKNKMTHPNPADFFHPMGLFFFCFFLIFWFRSGRLWQTLCVTDTDEQMKVCCVTAACCGNNKLTWKKILRECTTICVKMTVFAHCHGRLFWIFFGGGHIWMKQNILPPWRKVVILGRWTICACARVNNQKYAAFVRSFVPERYGLQLHPWRLTWNTIMEAWKIIFIWKWVICRFHLNLPGCMWNQTTWIGSKPNIYTPVGASPNPDPREPSVLLFRLVLFNSFGIGQYTFGNTRNTV